jgi:glutathione S-transferase
MDLVTIIKQQNADDLQKQISKFQQKLHPIELLLTDAPYFSGQQLALIDIAFAPLWMRVDLLTSYHELFPEADFPKIIAWKNTLLAMAVVQQSVVPEFSELFNKMLQSFNGVILTKQ